MFSTKPTAALLLAVTTISCITLVQAQTPSPAPSQSANTGAMPQFPSSNTVLQAALTDFSQCVDGSVANATTSGSSTNPDAVINQCAQHQAKLQQMLPPDAFTEGMAHTKQQIAETLEDKAASSQ